jgi:hypothetical protein
VLPERWLDRAAADRVDHGDTSLPGHGDTGPHAALVGDAMHCSLIKRFMHGLLEGQALPTSHAATNANFPIGCAPSR